MARWLGPRLPNDCRIIVSPAVRAQQTAHALQRAFETSDVLAPGASVSDVLRVANWPIAPVTTLIVGHEPTLGAVSGHLLDGIGCQRSLAKGALIWMESINDEPARAILKRAVAPHSINP